MKGGIAVFNVGDRVVYPMYGAGVIEGLESQFVDGRNVNFYVIRIPIGNLKIMVSVEKAEKSGLRSIFSAEKVRSIVNTAEPITMSNNWNQRYKDNMAMLKTGDLFSIMQVFKTLILRERRKSLSSIEKKLLVTAKQIILSEIILSQNVNKIDAEQLLMNGVAVTVA